MATPCCCSTTDHMVYLGLGSNLGDRQATLLRAYDEIQKLIGPIVRQSAFFVSQPWGFQSENEFLNSVVCCRTPLTPHEVLGLTQRIERTLGRRQKSAGGVYHDRPIDIDLLLYDHYYIISACLRVPHPLMLQRPFVMLPLLEIWDTDRCFSPARQYFSQ
ncbi:MAG: 2-amino-4-hydroxy-6-hydroxymethyldihydropteridine diphosphokinase [Prevotella sp.]|nr:2-amino-4-hydroxy-6-hydroxymethyldihydropteridine diphosphokinase [Prevotella sp.]